ncbi:hypothetical protein ACFX12_010919 [Malus domestica]
MDPDKLSTVGSPFGSREDAAATARPPTCGFLAGFLYLTLWALIGKLFDGLYDAVKASIGTVAKYEGVLTDLQTTLDGLRPWIIQGIKDQNVELDLPNDDIECLQQKMKQGKKLLKRLSKRRKWNWNILCICCRRAKYANRLTELNTSLKTLLEAVKLQEAMDTKTNMHLGMENLVLSKKNFLLIMKNFLLNRKNNRKNFRLNRKNFLLNRKNFLLNRENNRLNRENNRLIRENNRLIRKMCEKQDESARMESETLKIAREIRRAQQEAKGVEEPSGSNAQTVVHEQIGGSCMPEAASRFYKRRCRRGCLNKQRRGRGCLNAS